MENSDGLWTVSLPGEKDVVSLSGKIVVSLSGGELLGVEPEWMNAHVEVRQYHQDFQDAETAVPDKQDPGVTYNVLKPL